MNHVFVWNGQSVVALLWVVALFFLAIYFLWAGFQDWLNRRTRNKKSRKK